MALRRIQTAAPSVSAPNPTNPKVVFMSPFENYPRITPFLWFDSNAEEAVDFYVGIFKDSRRLTEFRNPGADGAGPKNAVITLGFELDGQKFTALNGGPTYKFSEAISLVVRCDNQEEIDHYYSKLLEGGGTEIQCGWLKDRFGLCWQIVPARIGEYIKYPNAMQAMMTMKKLDIAELERAAKS
jgi:predicted 3-demethylubiquinone-9 3-methyltransferase (glyoxalase superfamily)